MKTITLILFAGCVNLCVAQQSTDLINPRKLNVPLLEEQLAVAINKARKKHRCSELPTMDYLMEYSHLHADHILETGDYEHSDIHSDPIANGECLNLNGSTSFDEDTYEDLAKKIVQGWLDSPGHRDILLDKKAKQMGVGISMGKRRYMIFKLDTVYSVFTITYQEPQAN